MFQKGLVIKTTQINVTDHIEEALKRQGPFIKRPLTDFFPFSA